MLLTSGQLARAGGQKPEFNSISYHGLIRDGEWAVKIFSDHALTDEWLSEMFQGQVGWVLRKEWDAYPKVPPTSTFPPVKLDRGLYYVNAFEPFISTMETETVASRNVVDLMLSNEFNSGICGRTISAVESDASEDGAQKPLVAPARQETTNPGNFVLGWDC
ncbi:hypothetical protein NLJ89_g6296 [Agrocybe chaxingu]|uniref:Prenylcysteine lyase domain-containing protein n=1 Tax=Agrocybe chaxingu TaxID=84603 RepID=A0A9W8K5U5_9AGAR|nr:hypothetical protein NLJ89_g6296 [Agrocybe chaxingu]